MALTHSHGPPDAPVEAPETTEPAGSHLRMVETEAPVTTPPAVSTGGFLDLDPMLLRSMRNGILGGIVVSVLFIVVPLTLARGWAYGVGVGGQVAFWCGIGFGMIAGSAAYAARGGHDD